MAVVIVIFKAKSPVSDVIDNEKQQQRRRKATTKVNVTVCNKRAVPSPLKYSCFEDKDQVCDHLQSVAAFKVTVVHQGSNKMCCTQSAFSAVS